MLLGIGLFKEGKGSFTTILLRNLGGIYLILTGCIKPLVEVLRE